VSAYPDTGNRWPAVHRLDAACLFRLAVESAPASRVLHGVGEEDLLGWRPTQSGLLADLDHDDYVVS
jgi:hypothetical protein